MIQHVLHIPPSNIIYLIELLNLISGWPQKGIFKDLCRCPTKRRIVRPSPANPSLGMTVTKILKDACCMRLKCLKIPRKIE